MEELSEFLKDAYLNTSAETDSFTIDLKRQREITLQTLREIPDDFGVHFLAAAGLWGCRQVQVHETELPGYIPFLKAKRWEYRFILTGCKLRPEQLAQLPAAVNDGAHPGLKRMALALYQLGLGDTTDIRLGFTSEEAVLLFDWAEAGVALRSRSPASGPIGKLEVIFITQTRAWGKERLREAARWSPVGVTWQGTPLVKSYRQAARRQSLWWTEINEEENYEVEAFLPLFPNRHSVTVVGLRHYVPLEPVRLDSLTLEESFFPGLVLVIRSARFQVDGSQRRLVVNDNLMRLLRDVVTTVRVAFRQEADGAEPLLRSYLCQHQDKFPEFQGTLPNENVKTDPYHFRHGYAIVEDWQDFGTLQGVVSCQPFCVSSFYFHPTGVTAHHRSYPENSPQGVSGHPLLPLIAVRFLNYLEVWDEQKKVCLFGRSFPGLRDVMFARSENRLVVVTTVREVSKAWFVDAREGGLLSDPILLPASYRIRAGHQVLLLSSLTSEWRVLKMDGSSEATKLKLPSGAILWDINSCQDLALFSHGEQSYLVNLLNGQVRSVPGTLPSFHSQGRILTHSQRGLTGKRRITFYSRQLVPLETAGVEQHYSVSNSGVIAQNKHPCGSFLNSFVHYSYPYHPIFRKPNLLNFDGSPAGRPSEPLLVLKSSHELDHVQTLLALGKEDWEEVYRMTEPSLALTPTQIAWQVEQDTVVVSRETGVARKFDGQSLYKSLLTKKTKKRVIFQSLQGDSKRPLRLNDGPWRSHRHLSREGHTHSLVQIMPISLDSKAAVCCGTGECLFTTRAFRLEVNHRWAVKTQNSLLREPMKVYARPLKKGSSWRMLGRASSYALHPQEPRLYFLDRDGSPKLLDLTDRYAKIQNADTTTGWLTTSPSGRYLAVITPWQKTLYCSSSLRPLWHFNNDRDSSKDGFGALGSQVQWCNDRCILVDGLLYRTDEERGWSRAQRVTGQVQGALFCDGHSDLALRSRAGLIDLLSLRSARILATIQVDRHGWFAFTQQGEWEGSHSALAEITPSPQNDQRREGLLKDLIAFND